MVVDQFDFVFFFFTCSDNTLGMRFNFVPWSSYYWYIILKVDLAGIYGLTFKNNSVSELRMMRISLPVLMKCILRQGVSLVMHILRLIHIFITYYNWYMIIYTTYIYIYDFWTSVELHLYQDNWFTCVQFFLPFWFHY